MRIISEWQYAIGILLIGLAMIPLESNIPKTLDGPPDAIHQATDKMENAFLFLINWISLFLFS